MKVGNWIIELVKCTPDYVITQPLAHYGKYSRQQIDDISLIFARRSDLTNHANYLLMGHVMSDPVFWEKCEKYYFKILSAEIFT